jgi:hypothetical protein
MNPIHYLRSYFFSTYVAFLNNKINYMHQFHKFILSWNSTRFGEFFCPSSGVYSLYTQQWYVYMSYSFRAGPGPPRKLSTNLYNIHHCWVYSEWTPDDGQRNCPKHVEFHARINLWNQCIWLVLLQRNLLRCSTVTWT